MNAFDAPLGAHRRRAVRIGVPASLLALAAVVLYLALPGHGTVRMAPLLLVMALALATVTGVAFALRWARGSSDRRAALFRTVAAATNSMASLHREQVVTVLVDALLELGFDSASLAIYDEGG